MSTGRQTILLNSGWKWKQRNKDVADAHEELSLEGWRPVLAGMPSEVHVELMQANLIPHPFEGFNEHKVQCAQQPCLLLSSHFIRLSSLKGVGESEWMYTAMLPLEDEPTEECIELIFEGLDTFCSVYLVSRQGYAFSQELIMRRTKT